MEKNIFSATNVIPYGPLYDKAKNVKNNDQDENYHIVEEYEKLLKIYERPNPYDSNGSLKFSSNDDLLLFQIDLDYTVENIFRNVIYSNEGSTNNRDSKCDSIYESYKIILGKEKNFISVPIIRIYSITNCGYSVVVNVHNFFPYFYVEKPNGFNNDDMIKLESMLNETLSLNNQFKMYENKILKIEAVKTESIMYFKKSGKTDFLKITVLLPKMVPSLKKYFESGINVNSKHFGGIVYEANLPFILRYIIDKKITGSSWIKCEKNSYIIRSKNKQSSNCTFEIDIHYENIEPMALENEYQKIPKLRILSFDIECIKLDGKGFPEAKTDPIIQISSILYLQGDPIENCAKFIFTLLECASIPGSNVIWFNDEKTMLEAWNEFVIRIDPDFLTGYNIINFDIPYILNRGTALNLKKLKYIGRIKNIPSLVKDANFSSKQFGSHETKEININGRIQFDVYDLIKRDYRLKSYTLNYVSFEFLKEQKEDVHYSIMNDLQNENSESRKRIATYCIKDGLLPLRLIDKLLFIYNYVEMARVTGTPFVYLLTRGQQIKVTSQLYRKCKELNYIIPSTYIKVSNNDKFEGATVLEPIKGYYIEPISTLDFASLYPSIMIAHNLCYSTLIKNNDEISDLNKNDITTVPGKNNFKFVKGNVKRGVLPLIVEELIRARKNVKAMMKNEQNPITKMVLNGRQLALKISANSVYGYTGAAAGGQLPCLEIATSITTFGRSMIEKTKETVEAYYCKNNGFEHNATVVYGDTDSVMVKFGTNDVGEAMRLGKDAAERISKEFLHPIKLEFEKVYCPYLLLNKKRYAGLLYTNPNKHDKMDCKGIETVRRDFCILIQQMMETVLNKLLIEKDLNSAIEYTKSKIKDLLTNNIDMSLLVVTKSLGKAEYETRLPHVELAKKLKQRDSATAPNVGDRVSYIIIKGTKGQAQYERAEDPLYVLDNNLSIDHNHYLDAIKNPLSRIFEVIMQNSDSLFCGEHTRHKTILTSSQTALSKFLKKTIRCIGCNSSIKKPPLCNHCKANKEFSIYMQKIKDLKLKQNEFFQLWTECQRCQGNLHIDVICMNRDCPIFYRRAKIKKDVANLQEQVTSLKIEW
ncbi:DNA polymerase delta catalytic subunit, putative [Plasmodium berghei]|uniref:DNA polymerase n=2 Tax=Plasmodium berghei TaxID=5821 RepID=A0A509ADQ6_PLABA|nr:DNA polymerase delta catalytic subunit, putative [Plasmodium berghei ANKA]CXI06651.1 DNA polymerase delta catalytic subunit, putative [Plasmodium berghei]SCL92492.1 DNA polymerase delta catalytic subunit, putative [Plasmodium berghei]SCM15648.1 DNA polymerase delta catalytic subunit, putative [Plasmodium berghei]SCM17442.1 DNA polymerase delta catalytic subunit, putative [Plasmodium berghei]SCN22782.1 DNA polymerase delta catalytic subunit, putative [Plasmodium berghei]|eukprot:XP_034420253.1 DNA polymerase delta catalytic subunit, putative [Plasmodium berghei ANKA]